jgi:hypothetical protein
MTDESAIFLHRQSRDLALIVSLRDGFAGGNAEQCGKESATDQGAQHQKTYATY